MPPFGGIADARRTPDRTFQRATTPRTAGSARIGARTTHGCAPSRAVTTRTGSSWCAAARA